MPVPPSKIPPQPGRKSDGGMKPVQSERKSDGGIKPVQPGKPSGVGQRPVMPPKGRPSVALKKPVSSRPQAPRRDDAPGATDRKINVKIPLELKFAIAIALTVAVCSSIFVIIAYSSTRKQVVNELDDAGIRVIKILSSMDFDLWKKIRDNTEAKVDWNSYYTKKVIEPIDIRLKDPLSNDERTLLEFLKAETLEMRDIKIMFSKDPFRALKGSDNEHLQKIAIDELISIAVIDPKQYFLVAMRTESVNFQRTGSVITRDETEIEEGNYTGEDGINVPARSYVRPVVDKYGKVLGKIQIFVSAEKLNQVSRSVFWALMIPWFLALAIGGGIGYYLARKVTSPVYLLIDDIKKVSQGDLDHETLPHSTDEIGMLADSFNKMTVSVKQAHLLELDQKALDHEMAIANDIQSNLLPKKLPRISGYDVAAFYRPTKEIGGDYYDFIQIDSQRLGIVIADVSGKGIPGSMVMTMARGLIRMEAEKNLSTADTLVKVNRILSRDIKAGMFVTAMYAIWDVNRHTLLLSSAGHNPMLLWRRRTGKIEQINPNGIALGFDKGPIFERTIKESLVQLEPGDRCVFYTDGVTEAMNADRALFGEDRFIALCSELAEKESNLFASGIVNALDEHKGDGPQHDDITLATIRLMPY